MSNFNPNNVSLRFSSSAGSGTSPHGVRVCHYEALDWLAAFAGDVVHTLIAKSFVAIKLTYANAKLCAAPNADGSGLMASGGRAMGMSMGSGRGP